MAVYKVDCYKAKLVVHGFTQTYGLDYVETFVLVARLDSIQIILAIVVMEDMHMVQFDIKTTFIYGDIFEELYTGQAKGFEDFLSPHKMYKFQKFIYGLKQASCNWNQKFNEFLVQQGLFPLLWVYT
jgi:hypothetical protein